MVMNFSGEKIKHTLIITHQKNTQTISLEKKVYTIGRHSQNDIVIYSVIISRHHATILKVQYNNLSEEVFWIIDGDLKGNRSTNGIIVNGKRCLSHELKNGDIIQLGGELKIIYERQDLENNYINKQLVTSIEKISDKEIREKIQNKKTVFTLDKLDDINQEFLEKLSNHSQLVPHPILELDYSGKVIYTNIIAQVKFPEINKLTDKHPITVDILNDLETTSDKFLLRDIKIGEEIFQQYVQYLAKEQLIRIYLFDITKQKQTEAALKESKAKYKAIVKQISEGIFLVDITTRKIINVNEAYCKMLGYSEEEMLNLSIYDLMPIDNDIIDSYINQIISKKQELVLESYYYSKNKEIVEVEISVNIIEYAEKQNLCFAVRDIRERKKTEKLLKQQAYYDSLTGLPNKLLLNQKLELAIAKAEKLNNKLAIVFMDLDHFKKINDSLGHLIGDKLLKRFAKRILNLIRPPQIFARWGGDEFILLLNDIQETAEVVEVVEKIIESLKQPFIIEGNQLNIRMSMGIVFYPQDGRDTATLLRNADAVLYNMKQQGRNCYQFYNPTINAESAELLILENLLYDAIPLKQLYLNYQPQIDIETNQVSGLECLLRWYHPEKRLIPTYKFISLAEETGLIKTIGEWTLKQACQQYLLWQKLGIAPPNISVNLSALQVQQDNLLLTIEAILKETGLAAEYLELEITESSLIEDVELVNDTLVSLIERGIKIALDDFGTAYASLSYLKKFPFHKLKIDRSFIQDLTAASENVAVVKAIIDLAKALHLKVIAEGVETQEQLTILRNLGCEGIQGYYFSPPLGVSEIEEFLRHKKNNFVSKI